MLVACLGDVMLDVIVPAIDPRRIGETAAVARADGTRIAVDVSSAAMVTTFGGDA